MEAERQTGDGRSCTRTEGLHSSPASQSLIFTAFRADSLSVQAQIKVRHVSGWMFSTHRRFAKDFLIWSPFAGAFSLWCLCIYHSVFQIKHFLQFLFRRLYLYSPPVCVSVNPWSRSISYLLRNQYSSLILKTAAKSTFSPPLQNKHLRVWNQ